MLGRGMSKCKKGAWTTARRTYMLEFVVGTSKSREGVNNKSKEITIIS